MSEISIRLGEHEYRLIRREPYVRKRDGEATEVLVWQGSCAVCAEPFELVTGLVADIDRMIRTCPDHRGQTVRVARNGLKAIGTQLEQPR